jgi:hypothetical protein
VVADTDETAQARTMLHGIVRALPNRRIAFVRVGADDATDAADTRQRDACLRAAVKEPQR